MAVGKSFRHAGMPIIKPANPELLISAFRSTQKRYDTFFEEHDLISDPNAWTNELAWSNGVDISPRNNLHSAIQKFLKAYQAKDYTRYAFSECLCIWDVSGLCSKERFFRFPDFGAAFCIQFSDFTPYVVKMALANGKLGVYIKQDLCVPICDFFEALLRQISPDFASSPDTQLKFWASRVSEGKEKFNFSGLPYELRWLIIEQLGEDTDLWPFLYKRGDARCRYSSPEQARLHGPTTAAPEQAQYGLPGIGIFEGGSSDQLMLFKMSIRRNTFCFDKPGNLARFLDQVVPPQLRQVRNIHLNFSHDDFLSLFGTSVQPGHRHGRFAKVLKNLKELHLDIVWIEPKVSEDMVISDYFSTPQEFGCHSKAVKHICGLIARNLQNAKKLRLYGSGVRRGWQAPLDDMFHDAKRGEFTSDNFYALKGVTPPHVQDLAGGAHASQKRREPNAKIIARSERPAVYDAAIDLPPMDDEELGLLWPCECHDQCGPDWFNNRDPPRKKKVKQQTGGEAEETGILGEKVQLKDMLPLSLVRSAISTDAGEDGEDGEDEDDSLNLAPE
ncbi:hypothetical protein SLS55_001479 [Diplodia seriata]|uniref:Uncharacterized protein n=1 Tax=Diplodia seriata TaxID=420778 RepID=A0ABR3CPE3_9PEZI